MNTQLPVTMDEEDAIQQKLEQQAKIESLRQDAAKQSVFKPETKVESKMTFAEARQSMEDFKQPNCWIETNGLTQDAITMWEKIKSSQLMNFTYPVNFGEKRGTIFTANLNGLKFILRSGFEVQIPMEIYGLFRNKLDAETGVGSELRINRSEDVKQALSR